MLRLTLVAYMFILPRVLQYKFAFPVSIATVSVVFPVPFGSDYYIINRLRIKVTTIYCRHTWG